MEGDLNDSGQDIENSVVLLEPVLKVDVFVPEGMGQEV